MKTLLTLLLTVLTGYSATYSGVVSGNNLGNQNSTGTNITIKGLKGWSTNFNGTNMTFVGGSFTGATNTGGVYSGGAYTGTLTGTNAVLTTPSITGGTNTSSSINSPTITGGTVASALTGTNANLTTPTITGATLSGTLSGGTFSGGSFAGSLASTNAVFTTPSVTGGTNTGSLITGATITGSITGTNAVLTAPSITGGTNTSGLFLNSTLTGLTSSLQTNTDLTASRVLVSDASQRITNSTVSTTTLGYLDATSSVQTQLDGKLATNGNGGFITNLNGGYIQSGTISNAQIAAAAAIADTKLATISTASKVANSATTATSANTASAIVARDSNGDFSARAITLSGSAVELTLPDSAAYISYGPSWGAGTLYIQNGGTVMATLTSAGIASGLGVFAGYGRADLPHFSLSEEAGMGMFRRSAGILGFAQGNIERASVTSSGFHVWGSLKLGAVALDGNNDATISRTAAGVVTITTNLLVTGSFGVGTTTPQYTLDLNGQARIIGTNTIHFGGTAGAADATTYIREVSSGIMEARGTTAIRLWGNVVAGSANGVTPLGSLHASGSGSVAILAVNSQGNSPTANLGAFSINTTNVLTVMSNATFGIRGTITAPGTTGAQTINKPVGSVNLAAGATSLVVTDSCVGSATDTIVLLTVGSNDTTTKSCAAVVGTGQFTIYPNAAPTAETVVFFHVIRIL